jgi:hypothetical protein
MTNPREKSLQGLGASLIVGFVCFFACVAAFFYGGCGWVASQSSDAHLPRKRHCFARCCSRAWALLSLRCNSPTNSSTSLCVADESRVTATSDSGRSPTSLLSPTASFAPQKSLPVLPRTSCAFPLQLSVRRCHSTLRSRHRRRLISVAARRVHRAAFSTSRSLDPIRRNYLGGKSISPLPFKPRENNKGKHSHGSTPGFGRRHRGFAPCPGNNRKAEALHRSI